MTQQESCTWLKHTLENSRIVSNGKQTVRLAVSGKEICNAAFKLLYGISNNKYATAMKSANIPHTIPVHGNIGNKHHSKFTSKQSMFNWITDFVEECGDAHPTDGTIYVPKYIAKTALYSMYKDDWRKSNLSLASIPSAGSFFTTLEEQFSHVKFLRKTLLGRCDFCMSIPLKKKSITNEAEALAFKAAC
jgi:hypothetical protein